MRPFFFLFFLSSLFSTVNEPLRWEIFSGYRNDRIHWHIQDPGSSASLNYSEVYRDVQYWLNGLAFKVIHRDLTFLIRGAYGAFGKGDGTSRFVSSPSNPHIQFTTDGWVTDVSGYFGYAVNLTADRMYKVILTPLIGYRGHFEQLNRNISNLPGVFRLVWNGFFFGGQFAFETGGPILLVAGYAYNLLHNRVHTHFEEATRQSLKTSSTGNGGQSGWLQIDWNFKSCFRMGFGGEIHYFTTRVVDATISEAGGENLSQKFKLRWTPVSGWVQISRVF